MPANVVDALIRNGDRVTVAVVAMVSSWLLGRLARRSVRRATGRINPRAAQLASRVVYLGFLGLGALVAFSQVPVTQNLALTAVVVSALVAGTGIQDLIRNSVSGFYLLIEGNIKVGDEIAFDGQSGVVEDVRLRVSYLRGEEGNLIVVPNAELFNKTVTIKKSI